LGAPLAFAATEVLFLDALGACFGVDVTFLGEAVVVVLAEGVFFCVVFAGVFLAGAFLATALEAEAFLTAVGLVLLLVFEELADLVEADFDFVDGAGFLATALEGDAFLATAGLALLLALAAGADLEGAGFGFAWVAGFLVVFFVGIM